MDWDDINYSLVIGFRIDLKALKKKYQIEVPQTTRKEDRYDTKTGKKLPEQAEVVEDEGGKRWKYKNKVYEEFDSFIEKVTDDLKCGYSYIGYPDNDDDDDWPESTVALSIKVRGQSDDGGGLDILPWPKHPLKMHHELQRLKKACRHFGIKVGRPEIITMVSVSQ